MNSRSISRRKLVRDTALAAGIAASAAIIRPWPAHAAGKPPADTSKILNYNPDMEYRRLGKTGLMTSAVSLGGHARSNDRERAEVITRCIDLGINYIDACWDNEVKRDARALKGRRDRMYLGLSHGAKELRNENFRTSRKLLESLDELLRDSEQEYTDLWRITCFEPGGRHTFDTSAEMVDALEKAKKQGKARFIGFSTHDRRWIKFMIEYFPQIEVVCFPFTTMSRRAPTDSLFDALKKHDIGAFGIKPFAAGSLFTGDREEDYRRARLALRYILLTETVLPIPGVQNIAELDNVARAVAERRELDVKEAAEIRAVNEQVIATLPSGYRWLRNWESI
jgi:uncharacterized protein